MDRLNLFNQYRPLLFSIAYRMLGSVSDAEDMVQDTFLHWQQAPDAALQSPKAYLTKIITHRCVDHLRRARIQREKYVGLWLPEPLVTKAVDDPANTLALADSLSFAFLIVLESLSPTERAIFLLREVFDYDYAEISDLVGKSETNCRQIVRRSRQRLAERGSHQRLEHLMSRRHTSKGRSRFKVSPEQVEQITRQFMETCTNGDIEELLMLLAPDVTLQSDGDGKVPSALKPVCGSYKVARFLLNVRKQLPPNLIPQLNEINGQPSFINYIKGHPHSVISLDIEDRYIQNIYGVFNPDKLQFLPVLS